jgi:hypothetical protein
MGHAALSGSLAPESASPFRTTPLPCHHPGKHCIEEYEILRWPRVRSLAKNKHFSFQPRATAIASSDPNPPPGIWALALALAEIFSLVDILSSYSHVSSRLSSRHSLIPITHSLFRCLDPFLFIPSFLGKSPPSFVTQGIENQLALNHPTTPQYTFKQDN